MANNLFISYDLYKPGQHYSAVEEEIKKLGNWAKIHLSLWYVNSAFTASDAAKRIWAKMDANDKLIVVDATNNNASWYNLSTEVSRYLQNMWHK
jgi:hypothetical protein